MGVDLYGSESWSCTLREELRLRVFENRMVKLAFGPKSMKMGNGKDFAMRNFIVYIVHLI